MFDVRICCAGWSLPRAEQGHFPEAGSHLARYASRFDAVEIHWLTGANSSPGPSSGSRRAPSGAWQLVRDALARVRALAVLLAVASVVTLLLGAVGLYGILAYSVSIRRRELGIHMALGARPADIRRMVSLQGLCLAGVGIVSGTACALATSRLLRGLLYGVSPTDLVTLSATPAALLVVAFIAGWILAHRAAAVHPAEALEFAPDASRFWRRGSARGG